MSVAEEELCFAPPPSPTETEVAFHNYQYEGESIGEEKYEKSIPAHGDKMFYQFVTKIQANPGQIMR